MEDQFNGSISTINQQALSVQPVLNPFGSSMSRTIGAIAGALAKAQGEIRLPDKNRTVSIKTTTGGNYTFDYADLAAINAVVRDPLAKHGLAYTHVICDDERGAHLLTVLMHTSGEWISSRYALPKSSQPKDLGGAITYGKRYSLCGLLGVVADDDNDAEPNQVSKQPEVRQPVKAQPAAPAKAPTQPVHAQAQHPNSPPNFAGFDHDEPHPMERTQASKANVPHWNAPLDATPNPHQKPQITSLNGQPVTGKPLQHNGRRPV